MSATSPPKVLILSEPEVSAQISESLSIAHMMVPAPNGTISPEFIRDHGPFHAIIVDANAASVAMSLVHKTLRNCGLDIPTVLHRRGRLINRDKLISALRQASINQERCGDSDDDVSDINGSGCRQSHHIALIVDDDPTMLNQIKKCLEGDGYTVLTASDGVEALDIIRHRGVSIVISDINMPGLNGMQLCKAIRGDEAFGVVYFVMVSALTGPEYLRDAFEHGADDFVPKPLDYHELLLRVRAGIRTVNLERDLYRRKLQIQKCNAEMAILNAKLERLATVDELTGLLNRRQAMVKVQEFVDLSARYNVPLSCLVCDLDKFKNINDTYGHAAGDHTLARTAQAIAHAVRSTDVAARIGGEEFLVVCPNTDINAARALGERIRSHIEELARTEPNHAAWATISVGVAQNNPAESDPDLMIKRADDALYAAKAAGRNCVCVGQELPASAAAGT